VIGEDPLGHRGLWERMIRSSFKPGNEGATAIGIAAITGRYQGTVRMTGKDEPAGYTLVVEGKGKPGFVNGSANVALAEADGGSRTSVAVTGKAQVGGTIARVGQRLLGGVSKMMMDRFCACLQERAKAPGDGS